jgi:N-methylhydantoinase A
MGGTSTDVCRIVGGRPEVAYERPVGGIPVRMPSVAIHTVGAGGGSVAWIDDGGALRVGPRSAGATPGPVAYGLGGTEPTVTDADLVLGRLDPEGRLGESIALDRSAAAVALGGLGLRLGMSAEAVARGVVEVVEAHMVRALRRVSVEEGADPRRSWLVAFGGAGGLHATALARSLDMAGVVIPPHAGVFSALGLLLAPPRVDEARSVMLRSPDAAQLDAAVREVAARASERLGASGATASSVVTMVDMRYLGQSHETAVPYRPGEGVEALTERFHAAHRTLNGFSLEGRQVEAVTVRAEAVGSPAITWADLPRPRPEGEVRRGDRLVLSGDGVARAGVWWRPALPPGHEISGPAVVEEPEATTFLAEGERAVVHESGALEVEW